MAGGGGSDEPPPGGGGGGGGGGAHPGGGGGRDDILSYPPERMVGVVGRWVVDERCRRCFRDNAVARHAISLRPVWSQANGRRNAERGAGVF